MVIIGALRGTGGIVAGVGLALLAAAINATAIVLQASEDREAPVSRSGRFSLFLGLLRRPRWLAGTGLMVLAWPVQVLALGLSEITIVQPVLSTTQLMLLGAARVKLSERVQRLELAGVVAIVGGIALVVWAAPRHSVAHPGTGRLAMPLVVIGVAAMLAYLTGRIRPRWQLAMVVGAGLAYAWVDFGNKLLSSAIGGAQWLGAAAWLLAIVAVGALAFLQETTSLQRRPVVTVAPVIGAVHDPLPVLMALWAGIEQWGPHSHRIVPLLIGLASLAAGAAVLGRSEAVARVTSDGWPSVRSEIIEQ